MICGMIRTVRDESIGIMKEVTVLSQMIGWLIQVEVIISMGDASLDIG